MSLWFVFAAITAVTLIILLRPLFRVQKRERETVDYDVAIYRDQLGEIEKDIERGILTTTQADATRNEIYRRMLAAEDVAAPSTHTSMSRHAKLIFAGAIIIGLPAAAGLLYSFLGSPELPGKPYTERANDPDILRAAEATQLAAALETKPDAEGYAHLAELYSMQRRYEQAVDTFHKAIELNGGDADEWSALGETFVMANEGSVVPEAQTAFFKALHFDRHDPRARFYLGLAEAEKGDPRHAVAIWKDLAKDSPADAPWMNMVNNHIALLSKEGGFDPDTVSPAPPTLSVAPPMPDTPEAEAIMDMKPEQQQAMIRSMVNRLAAKMEKNPDDRDGWLRLAKAYRVLGETDKADAAEAKATQLAPKE
jgi:cytochrome c-type biogenesis protein CcmH